MATLRGIWGELIQRIAARAFNNNSKEPGIVSNMLNEL